MTDAPAPPEQEEEPADQAMVPVSDDLGEPGPSLNHRAPFYLGFIGGPRVPAPAVAGHAGPGDRPTLMLVVVALFLAAGLNPSVEFFEKRGMRRTYAVPHRDLPVPGAVALFVVAIAPVTPTR